MLTISRPLSAGQAQTYQQKEFTAKEQNYWSQQGVMAGEWPGQLAAQFGLAGAVSAEDFARLSQGQHPQTGDQLVRQRGSYEYQEAEGRPSKRWSTGQVGTRPFPRLNPSHSRPPAL
jgi:hypothetical protein